jgi:trigger factor
MSYEIGSGNMLDGLDDALIGLSAGRVPPSRRPRRGEHADEEVDVEVAVGVVKSASCLSWTTSSHFLLASTTR